MTIIWIKKIKIHIKLLFDYRKLESSSTKLESRDMELE